MSLTKAKLCLAYIFTMIKIKNAEIRKRVFAIDDISDAEFFSNEGFFSYLENSLFALLTDFKGKRSADLNAYYNPSDESIARTSGHIIYVNTGHKAIFALPSRRDRFLAILGIILHEVGHIYYSDFSELKRYITEMEDRKWYPAVPKDGENIFSSLSGPEIDFFIQTAKNLNNCIEDAYIESRIVKRFPGLYSTGLKIMRQNVLEKLPPLTEQLEKVHEGKTSMLNILMSQIMRYLYGQENDDEVLAKETYPEEYERYYRTFTEMSPVIDAMKAEKSSVKRFEHTNNILVILWPYIRDVLDETSTDEKTAENPEKKKDLLDEIIDNLTNQQLGEMPSGVLRPLQIRDEGPEEYTAKGKELNVELSEAAASIAKFDVEKGISDQLQNESAEIATRRTEELQKILDDLQKRFKASTTSTNEKIKLNEDIAGKSTQLQYSKDFHFVIKRTIPIHSEERKAYKESMIALSPISRSLQRKVNAILKERNVEGKLTGLPAGKRLAPRMMYHDDGKIFSKPLIPDGSPKLAVCLLVDESGSMGGEKIETAKKTALIVEDFLRCLEIPHLIVGHSADEEDEHSVDLRIYAEFDSVDENDRYRCTMIRARDNNRDGAALLYSYERLLKRPEPRKLLLCITDGVPYARGYNGGAAAKDCRQTINDYERKGVSTVALAIDGDKQDLEDIYSKNRFIDIKKLENLPVQISSILRRAILR